MFNFKTLGDLFVWLKKPEEVKTPPEKAPEPKPDATPAPKARTPRKSKEEK
jgi:hypothetical protein